MLLLPREESSPSTARRSQTTPVPAAARRHPQILAGLQRARPPGRHQDLNVGGGGQWRGYNAKQLYVSRDCGLIHLFVRGQNEKLP
jgi:hypothetical protein